jgi:hypothetical protein
MIVTNFPPVMSFICSISIIRASFFTIPFVHNILVIEVKERAKKVEENFDEYLSRFFHHHFPSSSSHLACLRCSDIISSR